MLPPKDQTDAKQESTICHSQAKSTLTPQAKDPLTALTGSRPADFMAVAIELAKAAGERGDIPIGAVVVKGGAVVGCGWNRREKDQSVTGHAELMALEDACHNLNSWRLDDCDLYVTLEPCLMCFGALQNARIRKLYFGAFDPKAGAVHSKWKLTLLPGLNHHISWEGGIEEACCRQLLKDFFRRLRQRNKALYQTEGGRGARRKALSDGAPLKRLELKNDHQNS